MDSSAAEKMAVLVVKERSSKVLAATVVPRKVTGEHAAKRAVTFMREIGCSQLRISLKSDSGGWGGVLTATCGSNDCVSVASLCRLSPASLDVRHQTPGATAWRLSCVDVFLPMCPSRTRSEREHASGQGLALSKSQRRGCWAVLVCHTHLIAECVRDGQGSEGYLRLKAQLMRRCRSVR